MNSLPRVLIWDLPTRLFHWLLALGFSAAIVIALAADDESPIFPYHALIGLTIALMVVLRVLWGLVGSRHARFTSFALSPRAMVAYVSQALRGGDARHAGHNPATAWAALVMLALILGLGVTGFLLGQGNESLKELHEVLAYAMVGVVGLHILGVALHTLRHRENITASMIVGRKEADPGAAIASPRYLSALVFLGLSGVWAAGLWTSYDAATQTTRLPLLGASVRLGEAEDEGHHGRPERHHDDDD